MIAGNYRRLIGDLHGPISPRDVRRIVDMSVEELAHLVGVDPDYWRQLERNIGRGDKNQSPPFLPFVVVVLAELYHTGTPEGFESFCDRVADRLHTTGGTIHE